MEHSKTSVERLTFADKIIAFNKSLSFKGSLPEGIRIMNPYMENEKILPVSSLFYKQYYNDYNKRHLILGINPGRFGAGVTGVAFTDTKRLSNVCKIDYKGKETHEPSSVFVYDVIEAFGGATEFYSKFYISAVCPLGFTIKDNNGREKNYNYYDNAELLKSVYCFIVETLKRQIELGVETDICYCFGTGKNEKFLRTINEEYGFFKEIIALEHPRFIMQYKSKLKQKYIEKYIEAFERIK